MRIRLFSFPVLLFICSILLRLDIHGVSGQCLSDQRSLLLQLKDRLIFNSNKSKTLEKWNQTSDCCSWVGVTCNNLGHVTGLNLTSESISGGIENSSLFNLNHLETLDLSYNDLNSTIPPTIGNLTNLIYLNLSNAGFGGQIPTEISHLERLVTLDFSINILSDPVTLKLEYPNLIMLIQNFRVLQELYLDGVNISLPGKDWCEALSSSLPELRILSLSNCYLSGPIDNSLEKLQYLSVIRLDNNNLSAPVPRFFAKFSNLTTLHLSSSELSGTFPQEIFQVPTLHVIDISHNPLLEGSVPEFRQNIALRILVLSHTNLSGRLPASIGNLKNLSRLEVVQCQFNGTLPDTVAKLTQLVYLDLSFNKFTGSIPSFELCKHLIKIDLSHNTLSGEILSAHWEGVVKLADINLGYNVFNGSIPSSLFGLPLLQKIKLSNNQFSGELAEFPNASSAILDTLDLSNNKLEGQIPRSIFKLRKLNILSLSSNKFNSTLQLNIIQGLGNLTSLDLSYNRLSVNSTTFAFFPKLSTLKLASCNLKEFPYLSNQTKLVTLDLSDNQIHGEVPKWIWEVGNGFLQHLNLSQNRLVGIQEPNSLKSLSSLGILDLHFNQLHGKIPILPPFAFYIDLSSNNFSSSIPEDIGNYLPYTIFLSLSKNVLTGLIPSSICNASYLQVLDLSHNSLSGSMPSCMSVLSQTLAVLNLKNNKLSGLIADAFPFDCGLRTLDLNGNSIQGQVPRSLAYCSKLEVLNLGNNQILDTFPCLLKNISTLRVLVLRSNQFYGSIGCPNTIGTWKMLQIIDLAHNHFGGKIPGQCLEKWEAMIGGKDDAYSKLTHLEFKFLNSASSGYYQDVVTLTIKGQQIELSKILTLFTCIDLSQNNFSGPIPEEMRKFKLLYGLNLSYNGLTGPIPSFLGNLTELEFLDLSRNQLNGKIPTSLVNLNFLALLNLSYNQLVGTIPYAKQFTTFSNDSFIDNKGLCGIPLTVSCSNEIVLPDGGEPDGGERNLFDWQFIYTGIGFGVGSGTVVMLVMLWQGGRDWMDDCIDKILLVILPLLGYSYKTRDQWDDDETNVDMEDQSIDNSIEDCEGDGDEMGDDEFQGQYCIFCSKLDISRKRVIHDAKCKCHSSPSISVSSSLSSSSSSSFL